MEQNIKYNWKSVKEEPETYFRPNCNDIPSWMCSSRIFSLKELAEKKIKISRELLVCTHGGTYHIARLFVGTNKQGYPYRAYMSEEWGSELGDNVKYWTYIDEPDEFKNTPLA